VTLRSMTGFGRARGPVGEDWDAEIFARGVNSRFLDLAVQTRDSEAELESPLRKVFARHLHRGKVEVGLRLRRRRPAPPEVAVDERLLDALLSRLGSLSERYPVDPRLNARDLLAVPQMVTVEAAAPSFSPEEVGQLEALAEQAALGLVAMREAEGASVSAALASRLALLRERTAALASRREEIARSVAASIVERVRTLFPDVPLDPGRLEQEAALAADRADVSEELERLSGHIDQFEALLAKAPPAVGKTLDFLSQEILRELNTLGSKSRDLRSTREVLDMKAEIEKIREQVQNVE
jgi:uncharacterized protein (TIGR00255 family)